MIIKTEICDLYYFQAWSGGIYVKDKICDAGLGEEFISQIEDLYPEGMTDTQLNDLLWHDYAYCFELVGLNEYGEIPEEEEEEEEEEE